MRSIEPEVIDGWLRYAAVEPEAFRMDAGQQQPRTRREAAAPQMVSADKAAALFARKYSR